MRMWLDTGWRSIRRAAVLTTSTPGVRYVGPVPVARREVMARRTEMLPQRRWALRRVGQGVLSFSAACSRALSVSSSRTRATPARLSPASSSSPMRRSRSRSSLL